MTSAEINHSLLPFFALHLDEIIPSERAIGENTESGKLRFMYAFSRFFIGLLVWLCASTASADDLINARAVLADPSGSLSIEQVIGREFQPSGVILSKGYTDSVHWLRLHIRAPEHGEAIELRIRPTYLDEIVLFEPDTHSANGWKRHTTGDHYAFKNRERAAISLGFIIHPSAPKPPIIYG